MSGGIMMSIYDYQVTLENGDVYSLEKYVGHPLLIVNTATKCGFAPQFKQLEQLYEDYQDQGLVVLGFPSNQFHQELDDDAQAAAVCRTTYGVTFPMHTIRNVNGKDALPLFTYLTAETKGTFGRSIKWNFTKFMVDRNGQVVQRFAPKTDPLKMIPEIEKLVR